MRDQRVPIVGLDQIEAVELSEILETLADWLRDPDAAVGASWSRHTGGALSLASFRADLLAWARLLLARGERP